MWGSLSIKASWLFTFMRLIVESLAQTFVVCFFLTININVNAGYKLVYCYIRPFIDWSWQQGCQNSFTTRLWRPKEFKIICTCKEEGVKRQPDPQGWIINTILISNFILNISYRQIRVYCDAPNCHRTEQHFIHKIKNVYVGCIWWSLADTRLLLLIFFFF